ncbi:MAG: hypothetical protein SF069_15340 [Phycisphaerae bacterium]|nr:hypothetical protein [Phycisphaerae bacterium]
MATAPAGCGRQVAGRVRAAIPLALLALSLQGVPALAQGARTEAAIWSQIETLREAPESGEAEWFANAAARRRALLAEIRNLLLLFPGSTHREAVIALELDTRWELLALDKAEQDPFTQRVAELAANPPNATIAAEAEYWRLRLAACVPGPHPTPTSAATSSRSVDAGYARPLDTATWEAFLAAHPESPRVPIVVQDLLAAYEQRDDLPAAERILELARQRCPNAPVTRVWTGRVRRWKNIGQPMDLRGVAPSSAASQAGALHVVWHLSAAALASKPGRPIAWPEPMERLSRAGVRQTVVLMGPAAAPQPLPALPGLQSREEPIGMSGEYSRAWGITKLPTLFLIGGDGRLQAVAEGQREAERLIERLP